MKVLVVGSGGREHALCWSLAASPLVTSLLCAPGNGGIARHARLVAIAADDIERLVAFSIEERVDLVVVGPEQPLVLGLVDALRAAGIKAFGPTRAAARLEGSKAFTKEFCTRHAIPTAAFRLFGVDDRSAALAFIEMRTPPFVIKADGLAAGKGVVIAPDLDTARAAIDHAFAGGFGDAGASIVIEEYLEGEEASLFVLCDGRHGIEFGTAQDHKRAFDGDQGPNTGGMGAYSPAPALDEATLGRVMAEIIAPTLEGMALEGAPFEGILYAGLMLTREGPKLIEYNVRFGDPECEVVLPRLMTDLCQLVLGALDGMLGRMTVRWRKEHALTVILASEGYPGAYEKGSEIRGVEALEAEDEEDVIVFHAGTKVEDGRLIANGGRVLAVTGLGQSIALARLRAYAAVARIDWPQGFHRTDIGWRALPRD